MSPARVSGLISAGGPATRRAGWGVADQALSSLTNFGLAVVLARGLTAEGFGAASITFAVYVLVLNVSRSLTSEPLTVRHSRQDRIEWAGPAAAALGAELVIGLITAAGLLVVALWVGGPSGGALAALAITMPGLLLQDGWRFAFFATGRPRAAFMNDLLWLVFMILTLAVALAGGSPEPWPYVLAWGLAGAMAGIAGIAQARLLPAPRRTVAWFRTNRDLATRYAAESIVLAGSSQLRLVIVGVVGGLAMAGALRAGQVIMNALNPLSYGLQLTAVPEAVAIARRDRGRLTRYVARLAIGLGAVSLLWGVAVWLIPSGLGQALFGATWDEAHSTIPGQTIVVVASGLSAGAIVGLRALAAAGYSLRARILSSIIGLVAATLGAMTGDVALCAIAIGVAIAIGTIIWWASYVLARRRPGSPQASATALADEIRLEADGVPAET